MPKLRLTIELVPASSWGQSLRNILPRKVWREIRQEVFKKSEYKCAICKSTTNLECHEVWDYDDTKHIQKLHGFLALCKSCHSVKHIGYATLKEKNIYLNTGTLANHFMKVNKCDRVTFNRHYKKAMDLWWERSRFEWEIIFGKHKAVN
jgi:hypothetical protein